MTMKISSLLRRKKGPLDRTGSQIILRRGGTWIQRWRCRSAFCAPHVYFICTNAPATLAAGAPISWGPLIRLGSGHLRKTTRWQRRRPYAHTRNPLYRGSLSWVWDSPSLRANGWLGILFVALFLASICRLCASNPRRWHKFWRKFSGIRGGGEPVFLPRITPYERAARIRFDQSLYCGIASIERLWAW